MRDRIVAIAPLVVGLGFLALLVAAQPERALRGQNDFVQLYTGGQLAGTPELYSREANLAAIQRTLGFTMETVVYSRLPFYAWLLKPLSGLPYLWAYGLFSLASFGAIVWFVWRFSGESAALPVLAAMGMPLFAALMGGQDTPFLLPVLGAGILLMRSGRDFLAGMVLALLAIKFHLFVYLPLALVLRGRWRVLGGGVAGGFVLLILGGPGALLDYYKMLGEGWIHYSPERMPNLHGMAEVVGGGRWLEVALNLGLLGLFLWVSRRLASFESLLGVSLICGLLASYHSGVPDQVLLYVALVLVKQEQWQKAAAMVLTPIPFFLVFAGAPWMLAMPLLLIALVAMIKK